MSTTTPQTKFTYQDYLLFPNDGKRYELIAGDRYVTPAPRIRHQKISTNLQGFLFDFVKKNNNGLVLSAPTDVVFSDMDVVQPDLLFVSRDRASIITEDNIQGAPDLVVEIPLMPKRLRCAKGLCSGYTASATSKAMTCSSGPPTSRPRPPLTR